MPLTLPRGVTAAPAVAGLDDVLVGPRVTDFRFEMLDNEERYLGTLDSVRPGGSLTWDYNAAVKGGGSLDVTDVGVDIDWLNVRLRPIVILEGAGVTEVENTREVSTGVFVPSAPSEEWDETGRAWRVELLDKNSVLDTDVPTDDLGNPVTFSLPAGANVVDSIVALIQGAGEATPAIEVNGKTLSKAMSWDLGATRLQIINDLLGAAGFFSLWVDHAGQYQVTEYVDPEDRQPVYELLTPFTKGDLSLMAPNWTRDRDIYSIPNRYVAVSQGNGDTEALVSTVSNLDPGSPFSYQSRGRWITHVTTGVEATTQGDLDVIARRGLTALTNVNTAIKVNHLYLPDLLVNRTVQFRNPDADLDMLCVVAGTTLPLDPTALCETQLREAVVDMSVGA